MKKKIELNPPSGALDSFARFELQGVLIKKSNLRRQPSGLAHLKIQVEVKDGLRNQPIEVDLLGSLATQVFLESIKIGDNLFIEGVIQGFTFLDQHDKKQYRLQLLASKLRKIEKSKLTLTMRAASPS